MSMTANSNPYAIFDKNSIKKGDFISHPPRFTLYSGSTTDNRRPYNRGYTQEGQPNSFGHSRWSTAAARDYKGDHRTNYQSTSTTFRHSDGHSASKGGRGQFGSPRALASFDHQSLHGGQLFMASNGANCHLEIANPLTPYPVAAMPSYSSSNFYHFEQARHFEFPYQPTEIAPLIFPPTDFYHNPPIHYFQQKRTFTSRHAKGKIEQNIRGDDGIQQRRNNQSWLRHEANSFPGKLSEKGPDSGSREKTVKGQTNGEKN